jgi:hypothetical protein
MRDHEELTDNDVIEFQSYTSTFKCIPNKTSNFDVFRLTNQQLTDTKAESIWEYYRTLFINAKLTGEGLSSFRKTLQKFIENKPYQNDDSRRSDINRYIGLARWLELQYNVDTTIDQLSESWDKQQLEKASRRIQGTVPFNNYVSYFTKDAHSKLKDPKDYENRKLLVRNVYAYTHKQIRWYVCASEYGAVKVWVHTKHNPFIDWFENRINNGVEINVVTSKILCNIDDSTPYIKIDNFFVDN